MHIRRNASPGFSLVELMFVLAVGATATAVAVPNALAAINDSRAYGAARYLSSRLQRARMDAIVRSRHVGMRVVQTAGSYSYTVYVDGNGDGIRTADILRGVDWELMPPEQLPTMFRGVDFGVLPGLPAVDTSTTPPGADPIKLGTSNIISFTALGTSSSGSLYVRGQGNAQYVIRIFGESGKTRVLKFDSRAQRWGPL